MNIQGKLTEVYDEKQITDKFKKREFVIEYAENAQYPQFIKFELMQNNCDLISEFKKGEFLDVHFDLKGKPWTNKEGVTTYFTSLNAWKIQRAEGNKAEEMNQEAHSDSLPDEDLPF